LRNPDFEVETRKIAHFAEGRYKNTPVFTLPALTMAPRYGTRSFVYAAFTPRLLPFLHWKPEHDG
jgi:hypothetical protein